MFKNLFLILFLVSAISFTASAKVQLPAVLSNNMVLQQKSTIKLWGTANKSAKLTVRASWDNKGYTVRSDSEGNWALDIVSPAAGGPYKISFDDGEETLLENILIGEVWVCSGQSNMEMPLRGWMNQPVSDLQEILMESRNDQIRVFTVAKAIATKPQDDVKGEWKVSNFEHALDFSAVAYSYAQQLQKHLNVPVGIIVTSWGGTPIRSWMSEASLKEVPEMPQKLSEKPNQNDPTVLYNAMIKPLIPYTIRGFLWYQGESDRLNAEIYERAMISMVNNWRGDWNLGDLPFYFVQIAPWLYPSDKEGIAALLREQQLKASHSIPNAGMAVTMDIGSDLTIHPPNKMDVGRRLSYHALAKTYGMPGIPFEGPELKGMTISGDQANLRFKGELGLYFKNKTSPNFEIAGADRVFYPAEARITNNGILVKSDKVQNPVAVRYGFKNYVEGDLFNTFGLPASSFRTDDW